MAAVVPDPKAIRAFKSAAAFEAWLAKEHARAKEVFIRMFKKDSGVPSVTWAQAVEVALCWGWIDGIRKSYDEQSFLQRFTPRGPRSKWSAINRELVARLREQGRMTPHGQRHIDAAEADGRMQAAYASAKNIQMPADLLRAIEAEPAALATFRKLDKQNLYALAYRTVTLKTAAGREKRIQSFVLMLKRGQAPHPIRNVAAEKTKSTRPKKATPKRS
jgi:uncharacterized protein YdeI (YjbR/CyaY-like superfamily)